MAFRSLWLLAWIAFIVPEGARADSPSLQVVAIGNSITWHTPALALGWMGNWGMSASSESSDYVSRLTLAISAANGSTEVRGKRVNMAELERRLGRARLLPDVAASVRSADLVVVELGDNVAKSDEAVRDFSHTYMSLLQMVRDLSSTARIVCLGTWWTREAIDHSIQSGCAAVQGQFVSLRGLSARPELTGKAGVPLGNAGVLAHPGDAGMAEIARRISSVLPIPLRRAPAAE